MQSSRYFRMLVSLGICLAAAFLNNCVTCMAKADAQSVTAEAVRKWQEKRFGMFIHWGPVSIKGTEIGWSRGKQVPTEEYDQLY